MTAPGSQQNRDTSGRTQQTTTPARGQTGDTDTYTTRPQTGTATGTATRGQQQTTTERMSAAARDMQHDMMGSIQIAPEDAKDRSAREYSGNPVFGATGERELGNISDFIVDAQTGRILYAVIGSGGLLGIGETLRPVPIDALQRKGVDERLLAPDRIEFQVNISKDEWDRLPSLEAREFNDGRIVISEDLRTALTRHFGEESMNVTRGTQTGQTPTGRTETQVTTTGTQARTDVDAQRMVRASDFRGKNVRSGDQEIGEIDEVIIDLEAGYAMALIDPDNNFLRSDNEYLVPLNQLQFPGRGREPVTTTLTASDFEQARMTTTTTTATGVTPRDPAVGATGRTTVERDQTTGIGVGRQPTTTDTTARTDTTRARDTQTRTDTATRDQTRRTDEQLSPTGADPALSAIAMAVRQELERDPALSQHNVQVMPENGKLVIRGTVPNRQAKQQVERAVEKAVKKPEVDNQLQVQQQR